MRVNSSLVGVLHACRTRMGHVTECVKSWLKIDDCLKTRPESLVDLWG